MLYDDITEVLGKAAVIDLETVVEQLLAGISGCRTYECGHEALEVLLTATLFNVIWRRPMSDQAFRRAGTGADMLEDGVWFGLGNTDSATLNEPALDKAVH